MSNQLNCIEAIYDFIDHIDGRVDVNFFVKIRHYGGQIPYKSVGARLGNFTSDKEALKAIEQHCPTLKGDIMGYLKRTENRFMEGLVDLIKASELSDDEICDAFEKLMKADLDPNKLGD